MLDSQPEAVRRVEISLAGLHVTDPDLPGALIRREKHARRLKFLAGPETRQGPRGECARCKARSTCFACPVAVACNGATGGARPESQSNLATLEIDVARKVEDAQLALRSAEASLARARREHIVARTGLRWVQGEL